MAIFNGLVPQAQGCTDDCSRWYAFQFVLCTVEMLACLSIIVTFGVMLRNVVHNVHQEGLRDLGPASRTEVASLREGDGLNPSSPEAIPPSFASADYPRNMAGSSLGTDMRKC